MRSVFDAYERFVELIKGKIQMSLKDKLSKVNVQKIASDGEVRRKDGHVPEAQKTAIGFHIESIYADRKIAIENTTLKAELAEWEGAVPAQKLDPKLIKPSKWANRNEHSFNGSDWIDFKEEISSSGGNVQPIKVRRIVSDSASPFAYEIVFGHRRHRACLELDLPVFSLVEEINDLDLFVQMDRENRQRADLRPFEQGVMYARALDEKLYSSARKLGEALGVDFGNVAKAVALARLPQDVVNAFSTPLDLQYRWATNLNAALQKDPDAILKIAKEIQEEVPRPNSKQVLERLLRGCGTVPHTPSPAISLKGVSGQIGTITQDAAKKSMTVTLENIDSQRIEELESIIKSFLGVNK